MDITERARSPPQSPLLHQDEVCLSEDEQSVEDEELLEFFTHTGDYRPGVCYQPGRQGKIINRAILYSICVCVHMGMTITP